MPIGDFLVLSSPNSSLRLSLGMNGLEIQFEGTLPFGECVQVADSTLFKVGQQQRFLEASFAPFALTQYFARQLQRLRPHRVVIEELNGATADLARVACAMGVPTEVQSKFESVKTKDAHRWCEGLNQLIQRHFESGERVVEFGYETYALGMRNHALLAQMQASHVSPFVDCKRVLDVGCGTGVFLDLLARQGIRAEGVERNVHSARFAQSLGLTIHAEDALEFLMHNPGQYDGLYCSHFVEHLPIDAVERLIALCSQALVPGGVAVFTFPDPESIRSQLLGFWRDPEHVRFYHPELIESLAQVHGLVPESNSQHIAGRSVGSFSLQPPAAPASLPAPQSMLSRWAQALGLATAADLAILRMQNQHQQQLIEQLWQVNQTWAWEDNVVLCLRKPLT